MANEVQEIEETVENGQEEVNDNLVKASKVVEGEKREGEIEWNPGANLSEAAEMYGEDTVFDLYRRAAVIKLQAAMRQRLEQGADQSMIEAEFGDWRPDVDRTPTRDPKAAILSNFNKLTPEEREALIAQLRG